MGFKDQLSADIGTFINAYEFAETVNINGQPKQIIIDEERLQERFGVEYEGATTGMILYFIPVSSLPERPKVRDAQTFNKRMMYVEDIKESEGLYEIVLTQNRGG